MATVGEIRHSADHSTLSEPLGPGRARVQHIELDVTVDFVGQRLVGHVDLHCALNSIVPTTGTPWELVLDAAENLEVSKVWVDGDVSKWSRDESRRHAVLGLAIRVTLPGSRQAGERVVVRIAFATAAPGPDGEGGCSALQWLNPVQTAGKRFPYLFSQCQAIHARAMFPCQDTCEVKATYKASVRCPSELVALMSAIRTGGPEPAEQPDWESPEGCGKQWVRYRFQQDNPIPAYLVAIVCGALECRRIGPRSHVWSEKEVVDECAWEFADAERFIAAGERLCGPYRWGVYDLLVLPPSFPYGGMENPCLTFVTPTLLAKDRSQVHVVAHEIAHSWSGNLVTNETWEHFWLNEGLTVFNELKILRDVDGAEESALQLAVNWKSLKESVTRFENEGNLNFTRLVPDLAGGIDPDDAFSTVPYMKGMALFSYLETLVGGEERFQPFIKAYFERFAGVVVTSQSMRDFFLEYFQARVGEDPVVARAMSGPIAGLDWEKLWYSPGMPEFVPPCDAKPMEQACALAARWVGVGSDDVNCAAFSKDDIAGWSTTKLTVMLDALLDDTEHGGGKLHARASERMAECYGFLTANCELRFRFLRLALGAKWTGAEAAAVDMATSQGRMKYTRPLFRALKAYNPELARMTFMKHRNAFHPICAKMVAKDLEL